MRTALVQSCDRNQVTDFKALFPLLDLKQNDYEYFICRAVSTGSTDVIAHLLTLQAFSVDATLLKKLLDLGFGFTSIHNNFIPCHSTHISTTELLLDYEKNKNLLVNDLAYINGLFLRASKEGHTNIALLLLKNGADIHAVNDTQQHAVDLAAKNGHLTTIALLNELRDDPHIQALQNKAFALAVESQRLVLMEALYHFYPHIDIHQKNEQGKTLFLRTAQHGWTDIILSLIDKGVIPEDELDNEGRSAVLLAAQYNKKKVLDALGSSNRVNYFQRDNEGNTAEMIALFNGHIQFSQDFITVYKRGINSQNNKGNTLLHCVIQDKSLDNAKKEEFVAFLLSKEANINLLNDTLSSPLLLACQWGSLPIMQQLIKTKKAKINQCNIHGSSLLTLACLNDYLPIAKWLLSNKHVPDINQKDLRGLTALHWACKENKPTTVTWLIHQLNIDIHCVDNEQNSPLSIACIEGHLSIVQILVNDRRAQAFHCNTYGNTPFMIACLNGHKEIAEYLLDNNCVDDINQKDKEGKTALFHACENGHTHVVAWLIELVGIDINAPDNDEESPLHIASSYGSFAIVEILVMTQKISAGHLNKYGNTPFMLACIYDQKDVAQYLYTNKYVKDINQTSYTGYTTLYRSIREGSTHTVNLLISYGADITIPDQDNETPLWAACDENHTEIIMLLLARATQLNIDINPWLNEPNKQGKTLWEQCARDECEDAIKLLLKHPHAMTRKQCADVLAIPHLPVTIKALFDAELPLLQKYNRERGPFLFQPASSSDTNDEQPNKQSRPN